MQDLNVVLEPARVFLVEVYGYLPRLGVAALVLVGGWLLAKTARFSAGQGAARAQLPRADRACRHRRLPAAGRHREGHDRSVGWIVYWLVILAR
jgi:hypothetical protein